jgi:hypothetical protein
MEQRDCVDRFAVMRKLIGEQRYPSGDGQTVRVEHVTVNEGGQVGS